MRGLRESERRRDRDRSGPHERSGHQGNGPEDHGLLGDTALFWHHREYPDSYHRLGEPDFVRQHRIDVQHVATELKHSFDRHFAGLPGSEFSEKLLFRTARDAAENGAARHPKEKTWDNRG